MRRFEKAVLLSLRERTEVRVSRSRSRLRVISPAQLRIRLNLKRSLGSRVLRCFETEEYECPSHKARSRDPDPSLVATRRDDWNHPAQRRAFRLRRTNR